MTASPEAILHLAGLHLLAQAGFASTSRAASLIVSSAAERYIRLVASTCAERASLAGRNKVAAGDVLAAIEEYGGGVEELWEWAVEQPDVGFDVAGTERLDEAIAVLRLVPDDELPEDLESDESEPMEVEQEMEPEAKPMDLTPSDYSWLPPLPGDTPAALPDLPTQTQPAPVSTADKYRRAIPFAGSLLSSKPFEDPPAPPTPPNLPPAPSSFPMLLETYKATASEPSVSLRQTDLRRQATEILRRSVASPDKFSPADTLSFPLPGPRVSPIIPSHSDTLPPRLLPVNPDREGMLSSLVHQMHSPHLPPKLRERLTHLRPPQPQTKTGQKDSPPIFYGEPVRGPDLAALNKARGKPSDPSEEQYLRYTWDSGPRGADKWSRGRMPTGRKVIKSGQGEDVPREPEHTGKLRLDAGATSPGIRLKIGKRDSIEGISEKRNSIDGVKQAAETLVPPRLSLKLSVSPGPSTPA